MEGFVMDAWAAGAALCGVTLATAGAMYGRLTVLTAGSAVVVGTILPMLRDVVFGF
jgi:hypothetical protein